MRSVGSSRDRRGRRGRRALAGDNGESNLINYMYKIMTRTADIHERGTPPPHNNIIIIIIINNNNNNNNNICLKSSIQTSSI